MTTYTFSPIDDPLAPLAHVGALASTTWARSSGATRTAAARCTASSTAAAPTLTLNDPSGTGSAPPHGINNAGQIVGTYTDSSGRHGFLYSGGTSATPRSTIRWPHLGTKRHGINNAGQVVGYYFDSSGADTASSIAAAPTPRSTIRCQAPMAPTLLASTTWARSSGATRQQQRGKRLTANGFLYSGGTYTTLDDPLGTEGTFAQGINDVGQIVGYYMTAAACSTASSTAAAPTLLLMMLWHCGHLIAISASTTRARSSGTTLTAAARHTASLRRLRRRPAIRLLP